MAAGSAPARRGVDTVTKLAQAPRVRHTPPLRVGRLQRQLPVCSEVAPRTARRRSAGGPAAGADRHHAATATTFLAFEAWPGTDP